MIRVRDAVETIIATSQTQVNNLTLGTSAGTENFENFETLELDCTKTRLNKGDVLRTKIEWISDSITNVSRTADYTVKIRTDPEDRLKTAVNFGLPTANGSLFQYAKSKQFKITIPFQLIE